MKLICLFLFLTARASIASDVAYVPGEVLVGIPHRYLEFPSGVTKAGTDRVIAHQDLRRMFTDLGVVSIQKVFPNVQPEEGRFPYF